MTATIAAAKAAKAVEATAAAATASAESGLAGTSDSTTFPSPAALPADGASVAAASETAKPTAAKAATAPAAAPAAEKPAKEKPQRPAPNKKSYLPTYAAPEAYGKKADPKYAQARKEAAEKVAKEIAKKERERARRKNKKKKVVESEVAQEDDMETWKMLLLVILGLLTALSEALDLDVLLGILFMPITSTLKYLSEEFDNVKLDPSYWATVIGEAYNSLCRSNAPGFVGTDLTLFAIFATLILFEADLTKWWAERNLRAQGYDELGEPVDDDLSDEKLENLFREFDDDDSGEISRDEVTA